ncbi:hypothetical protein [Nonomuraea diastatica]|uniref:Major facilitator superfamily (MFS) profile domain-containing protein n=1 Tax=Nonomuraea diastatica TaxID=1848329 RepID=A0A4R4VNW9_9ACTN|nr:hypothetical protein [Nonomuraea diastatica]TDD03965.1 hypothetical protein E1294_50440 [Nonomuraea diastatica]
MNNAIATGVIVGALLLALASLVSAVRNHAMGVVLLCGFAVLEVAVLVQAGVTVAAAIGDTGVRDLVTLYGYLLGSALIPLGGVVLALAERSRWGSGILVVAGFAVGVVTGRLLQIWQGAG